MLDEATEGISSKPLLISNWLNAQLVNYCNACGVDFAESANECVNGLRSLEIAQSSNESGMVETSEKVRVVN